MSMYWVYTHMIDDFTAAILLVLILFRVFFLSQKKLLLSQRLLYNKLMITTTVKNISRESQKNWLHLKLNKIE